MQKHLHQTGFAASGAGISGHAGFVQLHGRGGVWAWEVAKSNVVLLPYTAASVGVARRRLIADLISAGVRESAIFDVALVLSELLSNALRHASPLQGASLRVAWALRSDSVEVAVSDGGGQTSPELGEASQGAVGGRGLGIVAKLSRCWGVRGGDGDVTVWAEVPTPRTRSRDRSQAGNGYAAAVDLQHASTDA